MKAQLHYHSLPSHGYFPLISLGFSPFIIKLSSYSHGPSLECTQKFSTICLKHGLTMYSSPLGFSFLFTFFTFFLKQSFSQNILQPSSQSPRSPHHFGLGHPIRRPKIREVHIGFVGFWMPSPQHICFLRPKVLFFEMAFSTQAYDSNQAMVL